jgi:hypothetical protein
MRIFSLCHKGFSANSTLPATSRNAILSITIAKNLASTMQSEWKGLSLTSSGSASRIGGLVGPKRPAKVPRSKRRKPTPKLPKQLGFDFD